MMKPAEISDSENIEDGEGTKQKENKDATKKNKEENTT